MPKRVQINWKDRKPQVILDGVDVTDDIAKGGLSIQFPASADEPHEPKVSLTFASGDVTIDADAEVDDRALLYANEIQTLASTVDELRATVQSLKSAITTGVRAGIKKGMKS